MHKFVPLLCFMTMLIFVFGNEADNYHEGAAGMHVMGIIGAIADNNSRNGKEEIVAIKMALEDFYHHSNQRFVLEIRNSQRDPLQAALAGLYFSPFRYSDHCWTLYCTFNHRNMIKFVHHTFNSIILLTILIHIQEVLP